jgi:hypothetical protein
MARSTIISSEPYVQDIGPFKDSNDNIYVAGKGSTTVSVYKASDPIGGSFTEQDSSNRPSLTSLSNSTEQVLSVRQVGDILHIAVQDDYTAGGNIEYYTFHMSGATNPDTWQISETTSITIDVDLNTVCHTHLEMRSDGDVIIFSNSLSDKIHGTEYSRAVYHRRESGSWTNDTVVATTGQTSNYHAMSVGQAASDKIYLGYRRASNGDFYYKTLSSSNTLGSETTIDANPYNGSNAYWFPRWGYYDDGGTEKMIVPYSEATSQDLLVRYIHDGTVQSSTEVAANNIYGVSGITMDGNTAHLVWTDNTDGDIHWGKNVDDSTWDDNDTGVGHTGGTVDGVFYCSAPPAVYDRGSGKVLAFTYSDADSGTAAWYYQEESLGSPIEALAAAITGSATVVAELSGQTRPLAVDLTASGLVTASLTLTKALAADYVSSSLIAASISKVLSLSTDLLSDGLVVSEITRTRNLDLDLNSAAIIAGDLVRVRAYDSALSGSADMTTEFQILVPLEVVSSSFIFNIYGRTIYKR